MLKKEKLDEQLFRYLINTIELRNTFYLYKIIKSNENESLEKVNKYSYVFATIVNSLQYSFILQANKLFDEKEQKNIKKMILLCRNNIKHFENKDTIIKLLNDFDNYLDSQSEIINNINSVRDKFYAHSDTKYFIDNNKALIDFSINSTIFENLIEQTYKKMKKIYSTFQPILINDYVNCIENDWNYLVDKI